MKDGLLYSGGIVNALENRSNRKSLKCVVIGLDFFFDKTAKIWYHYMVN